MLPLLPIQGEKVKKKIKPATAKELAEFLGVSPRTIEQYPPKKKLLMKYGLAALQEIEELKPLYLSIKAKEE
jgi:transcriptional regulator with XRE-family HTH domain